MVGNRRRQKQILMSVVLAFIVSVAFLGQAVSAERTITVYKSPT